MVRYFRDGDLISGAVLLLLSIYILKTASQWTLFGSEGPGPGFFPFGYGIIMCGFSVALVYQALWGRKVAPDPAAEPATRGGTLAALATWLALAASIPLMWVLGFVVGFGLVIFFIVRVIFGRTLLASAITATAIVLALYTMFPVLLSSPLPTGMFWDF
jgi:hypothetical protein